MSGVESENPRHFGATGGKGEAEPLPVHERFKSLATIVEELDQLYVLLRGARHVNSLNEAKQAFQAKDYSETLKLVRSAGELHRRMHLNLLKQDPAKSGIGKKEIQRVREKQEKLKELLDRFDELAKHLEKMAKLNPVKPAATHSTMPRPLLRLSEEFLTKFQAAEGCEAQFQTVCAQFNVKEVNKEEDLEPGGLYLLQHQGQIHLIRCTASEGSPVMLTMQMVLSGKHLKPIPLEKLVEMGGKQMLHQLLPKHRTVSDVESHSMEDTIEQKAGYAASIIDIGSFSQLQMAAQQTGLVANADAIGFVREHEFRTGKYQQAFERIDGIYIQLSTAAEQRVQRLRQEEISYKSGVLKMSPKEWMLKQQRDIAQTQIIDRALRYFINVLDGLRIMMASDGDASLEGSTDGTQT